MSTKNTVLAAVYCRISKDKTGERAGVDRQQRECRRLAQTLGWQVIDVYTDNDVSAYSGRTRPEYERLLTDITDGRINAVIAWHPDRLHRSPKELERFIDTCEEHRVQNHTVQTGLWDLSTPSGRMSARVVGSVARYESEHKSERVRAAKEDSARKGAYQGGVRCYGYKGGSAKDGGGIEIFEHEADEIRRLANAVIHGQSLRSLAVELNKRGVPTATGKKWSSAHIGRMLARPRLAGLRSHHGKVIGTACWEPILTRETWEAVKAVLEDPKRRASSGSGGGRGRTPTCLGTGIYVCGVCNEPRLRLGRVGAHQPRRSVYRCGNLKFDRIGHVSRVADKLDAFVEGALLELLSRDGVIEALCSVINSDDAELAELRTEQATIRPRLNKAADRYAAGEIDDEQFARVSKTLRARGAEISSALTAANMRSPLDVLLGADNIEAMWDDVLTMGQKRAILADVLTVTVKPTTRGGRAPDGNYFNRDGVDIALTEQARSRLGDNAA
jgi:site-specific DNA recombinase